MKISKELKDLYERKNKVSIDNIYGCVDIDNGPVLNIWTCDEIRSLLGGQGQGEELELAGHTWCKNHDDDITTYEIYDWDAFEDDGEIMEESKQYYSLVCISEIDTGVVVNFKGGVMRHYSKPLELIPDINEEIKIFMGKESTKEIVQNSNINYSDVKQVLNYRLIDYIADGYKRPVQYGEYSLQYPYNGGGLKLNITSTVDLSSDIISENDIIVLMKDGTYKLIPTPVPAIETIALF